MTKSCGCCEGSSKQTACGCCEGISKQTPVDVSNRPGLPALSYRVGTHPAFLESMKAALSDASNPANDALLGLTTREGGDPAIALLDAWATVGDVLTFYQERIANEGYLRTAVERRSIVELSRLVGYRPRPGVSASVHLAFTLQKDFKTIIPEGTGAKTTPAQGQLPQTFETSEDIDARSEWNELKPRHTRPQRIEQTNAHDIEQIYFDGTSTKLKPNDRLLLVFGDLPGEQVLRKVASVEEDFDNKRTRVSLQIEPFSALAYLIDVNGVLDRQIADCPDLAQSAAILKLQAALNRDKALVEDDGTGLDQAVAQALIDLNKEASLPAQSKKNLEMLAQLAGKLLSDLNGLLGAPDATIANNVANKITAYNLQEAHASNVSTRLTNLKSTLAGGAKRSTKVKAWTDAKTALAAEVESTADYQALAKSIQKLESAWAQPLTDLGSALSTALTQTEAGLKASIAVAPAGDSLIPQLNGLLTNVQGAEAQPALDIKTVALESVDALLSSVARPDPLGAKLKDADSSATAGLAAVDSGLGSAASTLDHQELLISSVDATSIQNVHVALQQAKTQLPLKPLSAQPAVLQAALDVLDNEISGRSDLLGDRFTEVRKAVAAAPGSTAHDDLVKALNNSPIPTNFPDNSKEKAHAQKLISMTDPIRQAAAFADSVSAASTAVGQIAAEQAAIQQDAQAVAGNQTCIKNVIDGLQTVQNLFVGHFLSDLRRIYDDHQRQLGALELRQQAVQALAVLLKLVAQGAPSVTALTAGLKAARTEIQNLHNQVPSGDARQDSWFKAFETDLNTEYSLLTKAKPQTTPQPPDDHDAFTELGRLADTLSQPLSPLPSNPLTLIDVFQTGSDLVARSLIALHPQIEDQLVVAWANQRVQGINPVHVFAFRVRASVFGATAPTSKVTSVSMTKDVPPVQKTTVSDGPDPTPNETPNFIYLDNAYDQIVDGTWLAIQAPGFQDPVVVLARAGGPLVLNRTRYGLTGKATEIKVLDPADPLLAVDWYTSQTDFSLIRETAVYAQSEELALAEEPVDSPIAKLDTRIELDGFYSGLKAGRSVVVSGERSDVAGVVVSELGDTASISQSIDTSLPGDTLHTTLILAAPLQFTYKRETVKINANVAHATHGETQKQVLGSGDGSQVFQSFGLSHLPLTYLSAPTASGAQSTLQVRVNDVLWHEADNFAALQPKDRQYIVDIEDDGATSAIFGDGHHGARLPSGVENVRALYRNGIGKPGNVPPGQINILGSPPLGVTAVNNPDAATGGADPETRDQARRNAPLAVTALDRLVSVSDFADYARSYAGVAKAVSTWVAGLIHVTIAGLGDIPISTGSDLFLNLQKSFKDFGDPHQRSQLAVRELLLIVMSGGVAIDPDYEWDKVQANVQAALFDAFGFENRELGRDVMLSEIVMVMQRVPGVLYVRVDKIGAISIDLAASDPETLPQKIVDTISGFGAPPERLAVELARLDADGTTIRPAQIAYISSDLPETVLLSQILPGDSHA